MNYLTDMLWVEWRKVIRSGVPLGTVIGSLVMPLGIGFLIFVSKNPDISRKLGLISAKADLLAFSATEWSTYMGLFGQLIAAGGFFLFVIVVSWVFGREFSDGTVKDLLAVPVTRASILLAKFIVASVWSLILLLVILTCGIVMGALIQLPASSLQVIARGAALVTVTGVMVIAVVLPFALFASLGRGYLLPLGMAVLILMLANVAAVIGYGEYFPWAVPGLYSQGIGPLGPISYWIVVTTCLAGILATHLWWKYADQNR
jgi:ABC-2 type transport system permease protein